MNKVAQSMIAWKGLWPLLVAIFVFVSFLSVFGQGNEGNNAVYNSSGNCSQCAGTSAFIDASVFLGTGSNQGSDLCDIVFKIIKGTIASSYTTVGAVIDTRGLSGSALTCAKGSPWSESGSTVSGPSVILLPAGTITIQAAWVVPANTHIIGQGDNLPNSQAVSGGTTILAANTSVSPMISFCASAPCAGVAVEKLVLNGNGLSSITGIENSNASSLSYVDHVGLYQVVGTGLLINNAAGGSGPYTNINFNTGNANSSSSTVCAQIGGANGLSGTAGIRGLSCTASNSSKLLASAAVLLDASNNSIKDVTIIGFNDGILVGSNAPAQNNVLMNIIGDTPATCLPNCVSTINEVHISATYPTTSDIVIMGVSNESIDTFTIEDDLTHTVLRSPADPFVALYALGKNSNNGYARFTTSPSVPSWATGTQSPPAGSCAQGSIYSCTASTCSHALWGCPAPGGSWGYIQ